MNKTIIRWAAKKDGKCLLALIDALADFERLKKPTRSAQSRLLKDAFGPRQRIKILLAVIDRIPVGYAIFFESYSSFLARPTLFLEDLFVLPERRKHGIGKKLFQQCVTEARKRSCGRMEWIVLSWNRKAIRFYRSLGAKQMDKWRLYRLEF